MTVNNASALISERSPSIEAMSHLPAYRQTPDKTV